MIEQTEKRTIKDIEKLVRLLDSIYSSFYQNATSSLRVLKKTSDELLLVHPKQSCFNMIAFSLQIYQKVWQNSSNRILKLQDNHYYFLTLNNKIKQFEQQYKQSMNSVIEAQKNITSIRHMHKQMQKVYHSFQKPIKYYNNIQRLELKKQLKERLEQYLTKKYQFMLDYPSKKKSINHIFHMSDWFNKEIDQGLFKGILTINKIEDGFLSAIRQFLYYIIDVCSKQILKFQKLQIQSHWSIQAGQMKRQNLAILNKLQSQYLQSHFQKYFKFCKKISQIIQQQIKYSQRVNTQIKTIIQVLNSAKRQIQKQLSQADLLKEKLSRYCSQPLFLESYKLTLSQLVNIIKITINSITFNSQLTNQIEKLNSFKKQINIKIKTDVAKQIPKNSQILIGMYETKLKDLNYIYVKQNTYNDKTIDNSKFDKIYRRYKRYISHFNFNVQTTQKEAAMYVCINTAPALIKTILVKDVLTLDLLNDDSLQKQITKSLQQFPVFTKSDKLTTDRSYNCSLSGKIPLIGKLQLFPQIILFRSNFNDKNIFFGKTSIVIPINDIIQITKQTVLLIDNAINISTKKGSITFVSFYDRNKVLQQINEHLQAQEQETKTNKNNQSFISQISQIQTLTPQDITTIQNKKQLYDKSIFEPYQVFAGTRTLPGMKLRKVFKQMYSSNIQVTKRKQKYSCFKQYALLSTQNQDVTVGQLQPPPPSYFDSNSTTKLSELKSSQRTSVYKHLLGSLPIPFMPKFGNVTQKQIFHWISDKMIIIQGQNLTTGAPYSDTFVLKIKSIIQQTQKGVVINSTGTIIFVKSAAFQSIIKSTGEKQIAKNTQSVLKLTQQHAKQLKKKKTSKSNNDNNKIEEVQQQQQKPQQPQSINKTIEKLNFQNKKNLIIISVAFAIVLLLTHIIF